jgi:hypothetical protein
VVLFVHVCNFTNYTWKVCFLIVGVEVLYFKLLINKNDLHNHNILSVIHLTLSQYEPCPEPCNLLVVMKKLFHLKMFKSTSVTNLISSFLLRISKFVKVILRGKSKMMAYVGEVRVISCYFLNLCTLNFA